MIVRGGAGKEVAGVPVFPEDALCIVPAMAREGDDEAQLRCFPRLQEAHGLQRSCQVAFPLNAVRQRAVGVPGALQIRGRQVRIHSRRASENAHPLGMRGVPGHQGAEAGIILSSQIRARVSGKDECADHRENDRVVGLILQADRLMEEAWVAVARAREEEGLFDGDAIAEHEAMSLVGRVELERAGRVLLEEHKRSGARRVLLFHGEMRQIGIAGEVVYHQRAGDSLAKLHAKEALDRSRTFGGGEAERVAQAGAMRQLRIGQLVRDQTICRDSTHHAALRLPA